MQIVASSTIPKTKCITSLKGKLTKKDPFSRSHSVAHQAGPPINRNVRQKHQLSSFKPDKTFDQSIEQANSIMRHMNIRSPLSLGDRNSPRDMFDSDIKKTPMKKNKVVVIDHDNFKLPSIKKK